MNVEEFMPDDLDVQKAVVESLAADKAAQDEKIDTMGRENAALKSEIGRLQSEISVLKDKIAEMKKALENVGDVLAKNAEMPISSQVALLERPVELNDRFAGETHDHVLEVIREARDAAEKDGRVRRAQVLEGVLTTNESTGNLEKKRLELKKLFDSNANVMTGPVIEALQKMGLSHKNGKEYLLMSEVLKRAY